VLGITFVLQRVLSVQHSNTVLLRYLVVIILAVYRNIKTNRNFSVLVCWVLRLRCMCAMCQWTLNIPRG